MTIDKIKKIIRLRAKKLPKYFEYIIERFKINNELKNYIYGISYRTSITLPHDSEIDLDIHPLFKSKSITDKEKLDFTILFLERSIETVNKLKFSDSLLKILLKNIKMTKLRPFDLKICFGWEKETLKPKRYTLYTNYNSQKHLLDLFNNILPKNIMKRIKKFHTLIDTIAIDVFYNNKKSYKIYYRKPINKQMVTKLFPGKITSLYLMKSYPQDREKRYIHFSNSIDPKPLLIHLFNKKIYNDMIQLFKMTKYVKLYFIGYTKKPFQTVSFYFR